MTRAAFEDGILHLSRVSYTTFLSAIAAAGGIQRSRPRGNHPYLARTRNRWHYSNCDSAFRNKPSILSRLTNTVEYISHQIICSIEERPLECSVRIDVGFRGLTPLNTTLDDNAVVLVAVTGLAGRAFGSWQARNGSMWLRDFLPKDVAHLRIFTYGYPSSLFKSLSTAGLLDFTLNFMDELKTYLGASKTRRLILVGHSLGCLVIKQALCECGARGFHELERAVLAVIFFGPPHRGLNNPKLQERVLGTPPEALVQDIRKGSSVLTNLNEAFASICRDLFVVTCFEMLQTPTITVNEAGEWKRDGPPEMMVDRDSACLYAANKKRIPVHADHSLIAKLNNDPGSEYHSVKEAIELIVHRASGIRYQASTLFHQCLDIYKVFVSAVEAGNQIILAKRFQVELTKFELWGRLSDIVSIRSLPNTNESEDYRLENSTRQVFELLQEITDEGTLGKRFGINFLSSSYQSHQSDITSNLNSAADATPISFPPTEACLNNLRFKIDRFQTLHNAILPSLQYSGCRAFDQLFTAALLRTNSDADFSGVETSDGIIPSDLRRSATLKLLGLEMKSGILERLKKSSSLKVVPATLDLVNIPKAASRFITIQTLTEIGSNKRVFIEWRYYDRKTELARSGDISVRIDNLMKILTCSPRPTSLCILDYFGYFHDFNHDRFGFVCNLPSGASTQGAHRTLNSLLGDSNFKPSLTDRFHLANAIVRCVHQFHLLGWFHKGINSHNVIHFQMESDKTISICTPFMTGSDLSREDSPVEISEKSPGEELDIYRYVDYRNGSHTKFKASFDVYALGLVLLEIGFWRPLNLLAKTSSVAKSESAKRVDEVLPTLVQQLRHRVGDRYHGVVQMCLQAPKLAADKMTALEEGLIELDRCSL